MWGVYWKLHDKRKRLVARLKGYLDGLPPKTRRRIVLAMLAAFATPNGDDDSADSARVLAESLLPLAAAEWRKHREDILWDPAEAKRAAKEEDERKNKEALAAKFAHIKDDPSKPRSRASDPAR